jgi:hypothetical protein
LKKHNFMDFLFSIAERPKHTPSGSSDTRCISGKSNIPKAGIASSHYIISKEIIADPALRIPRCQWN